MNPVLDLVFITIRLRSERYKEANVRIFVLAHVKEMIVGFHDFITEALDLVFRKDAHQGLFLRIVEVQVNQKRLCSFCFGLFHKSKRSVSLNKQIVIQQINQFGIFFIWDMPFSCEVPHSCQRRILALRTWMLMKEVEELVFRKVFQRCHFFT